MNRELKRAQVVVGRAHGASPQARERMNSANEGMQWTAVCCRCKAVLKGTLKELREHACGLPKEATGGA